MEDLEILYLTEKEKSWIDTSLNAMFKELSRHGTISIKDEKILEDLIQKINDL
jgi:hypothetical protein